MAFGAEGGEDVAYGILIERHLEGKIAEVVTGLTGTTKVIPIVHVEVRASRETSSSRGSGQIRTQKKDDALILPGVPAKKEFGKSQSEVADVQLPQSMQGRYAVGRVDVTVLIGKSLSEEVVQAIRDMSMRVVGFDEARGDTVEVRQLTFGGRDISWSSYLLPPNLYWFVLSVLGGFFLFMAAMFLRNPFRRLAESVSAINWGGLVGGGSTGGSGQGGTVETHTIVREASQGAETGKTVSDEPMPFSFVQERHLPGLAFLLQGMSPEDIAVVVNYLGPELVSRLIELFPEQKQVEIALSLRPKEMDSRVVQSLEDQLRARLDFIIGGETKLVSLLSMADDRVRESFFERLALQDRAFAERLRKRIKGFDALIRELSPQGLQVLYRRTDPTLFAQVLKSSPDDVRDKVMASLSEGAVERLRQEIELSPPLPPKRLQRERHAVTDLVLRLISEGAIEEVED